MELTGRLLRWAAARPHLLVAEAVGGTQVRLQVERELRANGWPPATGPADADLLVVCGRPDAQFQDAVETTWQAMPGPRARVQLTTADDVADRLTHARTRLADAAWQRADAASRSEHVADDPTPEAEAEDGGTDHGDMEMEMDMSLPGGLVMADRAPDRDGLELDVLHLRLGPILASWPAGLAVDVVMQGDVVQEAAVVTYAAESGAGSAWSTAPDADGRARAQLTAAAHLDSAGRLLQLAGWGAAAAQASRLRDDVLTGAPTPELVAAVQRLTGRVGRSWSLRSGLRDLAVVRTDDAERRGLTGPAARADGDVLDRLLQWLVEAYQGLDGEGRDDGPRGRNPAAVLDALPALLVGLEVGAVRLVVASLDPDVAELVGAAVPGG